MLQTKKLSAAILLAVISFIACKKEMPVQSNAGTEKTTATIASAVASSLTESFESGIKTSYTAGSITLSSGS